MALRAEQWMVLGFGAIGVYALARLLTAKPRDPAPDQTPAFRPDRPDPNLPPTPAGPVTLQQNIIAGGAALLRPGLPYRGRVEMPGSTRASVTARLKTLGFGDDVLVYTLDEAQNHGMIGLASPSQGSRWFEGTWRGRDAADRAKPSVALPIPADVVLIWPTVRPFAALTASGSGPWGYAG